MFSETTLERVSASVPSGDASAAPAVLANEAHVCTVRGCVSGKFPGLNRADIVRSPPWLPIQMRPRPWPPRLASLQMCFLEREGRHENRGNLNLTGRQAEPEPLRQLRHLLFLGSSSRIWFVFPSFPSISFLRESAAYTGSAGSRRAAISPPLQQTCRCTFGEDHVVVLGRRRS